MARIRLSTTLKDGTEKEIAARAEKQIDAGAENMVEVTGHGGVTDCS
jgi:hypothetical protein